MSEIIFNPSTNTTSEDIIKKSLCIICKNPAETIYYSYEKRKWNGELFKSIPLCNNHKGKLNQILNGTYDIDNIILNPKSKINKKGLRFR